MVEIQDAGDVEEELAEPRASPILLIVMYHLNKAAYLSPSINMTGIGLEEVARGASHVSMYLYSVQKLCSQVEWRPLHSNPMAYSPLHTIAYASDESGMGALA